MYRTDQRFFFINIKNESHPGKCSLDQAWVTFFKKRVAWDMAGCTIKNRIQSNFKLKVRQSFLLHHSSSSSSLTLSRHSSLSLIAFGRSSGLHPVSSHSCCMYVRTGRPTFAWPYVGVHKNTSLGWVRPCFSSSVLRVWFV